MSKLKSAVLYEYLTKVKAIGIFYLIQYLIVALIFTIVAICTKGNETGSNTLEFSSVVFVSVIGVLGYKEDFKALLQNGYTRKYIFGATVCMFTLLAGTMALIDTIIGNSLHFFNSNYFTLYSSLYWIRKYFYKLVMAYCFIFDVLQSFLFSDFSHQQSWKNNFSFDRSWNIWNHSSCYGVVPVCILR